MGCYDNQRCIPSTNAAIQVALQTGCYDNYDISKALIAFIQVALYVGCYENRIDLNIPPNNIQVAPKWAATTTSGSVYP